MVPKYRRQVNGPTAAAGFQVSTAVSSSRIAAIGGTDQAPQLVIVTCRSPTGGSERAKGNDRNERGDLGNAIGTISRARALASRTIFTDFAPRVIAFDSPDTAEPSHDAARGRGDGFKRRLSAAWRPSDAQSVAHSMLLRSGERHTTGCVPLLHHINFTRAGGCPATSGRRSRRSV